MEFIDRWPSLRGLLCASGHLTSLAASTEVSFSLLSHFFYNNNPLFSAKNFSNFTRYRVISRDYFEFVAIEKYIGKYNELPLTLHCRCFTTWTQITCAKVYDIRECVRLDVNKLIATDELNKDPNYGVQGVS